jgi:hypothetical protein
MGWSVGGLEPRSATADVFRFRLGLADEDGSIMVGFDFLGIDELVTFAC